VLLLANHIGSLDVLRQALSLARAAGSHSDPASGQASPTSTFRS